MTNRRRKPANDTAVAVGRVGAPHGIHGEVKVESLTDFPERFADGSVLWLNGAEVTVTHGRWQGRSVVLKLEGVDTRGDAEALRGAELTVPEPAELEDEGVYYVHDIIGMRVQDQAGADLGKLAEVINTGSNDVYVVRSDKGELLLPALDDVILTVDLEHSLITVDIPEGIDYQGKPSKPRPRNRRPAQAPDGSGYQAPQA